MADDLMGFVSIFVVFVLQTVCIYFNLFAPILNQMIQYYGAWIITKAPFSFLNSNKVSGFGDIETVSNPYTPDVDGLIRIYFSPSGNTNATVYATQNGISHFSTTSSGGANIAQFFPAKAGNTYQGNASQPGTIQLAFMPLQKE